MVYLGLGLLFVVTAILTAAEMATFSARPERMKQYAQAGDKRGTLVLAYQRSPVSFLSAGQVIATAASFVIGALLQTKITPIFVSWLDILLDMGAAELEALGSTLALIVMTVLALILTNVVPKQIGFDHADRVAMFFSRPFRLLIRLNRPIAWLVTVSGQVFERVVNRRNRLGARVTEADLLTLMAEGIRIGALDKSEGRFVRNALRLSDLRMRDVFTPLGEIEAIDSSWSRERIDVFVRSSKHSFLPVYDGHIDSPVGVLKARDWLLEEGASLHSLLTPLPTLSEDDSAVELFQALMHRDTRILFVQSAEKTVGMVTLNDAIRLLAGEMSCLRA